MSGFGIETSKSNLKSLIFKHDKIPETDSLSLQVYCILEQIKQKSQLCTFNFRAKKSRK